MVRGSCGADDFADRSSHGLAGELGFEPRQTESESVVLPLHHSPRIVSASSTSYQIMLHNYLRREFAGPITRGVVLLAQSRLWQARGEALHALSSCDAV